MSLMKKAEKTISSFLNNFESENEKTRNMKDRDDIKRQKSTSSPLAQAIAKVSQDENFAKKIHEDATVNNERFIAYTVSQCDLIEQIKKQKEKSLKEMG